MSSSFTFCTTHGRSLKGGGAKSSGYGPATCSCSANWTKQIQTIFTICSVHQGTTQHNFKLIYRQQLISSKFGVITEFRQKISCMDHQISPPYLWFVQYRHLVIVLCLMITASLCHKKGNSVSPETNSCVGGMTNWIVNLSY